MENEVVAFKSGADVRLYVSGNIDEVRSLKECGGSTGLMVSMV